MKIDYQVSFEMSRFLKSELKVLPFLVALFANVLVMLILLIIVSIVIIGIYHTTIYVITNALTFYFYLILPLSTLFFASKVPTLTNPVYSLLCLILVFFQMVVFYLVIGAEFLAFVFLIVYVGAIAILFLFVIMLLNVKELASSLKSSFSDGQVVLVVALATASINFIFSFSSDLETFFLLEQVNTYFSEQTSIFHLCFFVTQGYQDIFLFSNSLYNYYSYLFILISFLLLTAMIGAIVLATSTFEVVK